MAGCGNIECTYKQVLLTSHSGETILTANTIRRIDARADVNVTMKDGSVWSGPAGEPLESFMAAAYPNNVPGSGSADLEADLIVAGIIDGTLRELMIPVQRDVHVEPLHISASDGLRIYRRSLSMLLLVAVSELFPGRKINIDHSLPFGGYYCNVHNGEPFTVSELKQIKQRMLDIVEDNVPFIKKSVPLDEAVRIFTEQDDDDKLRLLKSRKKSYLNLYGIRGLWDYFYGYMLPSTSYLRVFDLSTDGEGFMLHYPRRQTPAVIQPVYDMPKLRRVFHETGEWLDLLGVPDIGALNEAIREGRARELILVAEALHESSYVHIAHRVKERWQDGARLVLIAGPSSAGKTTSSKRIAVQLQAEGLKPYTMEVDNYFVDREQTPRDEYGEYDFEHLNAVDIAKFNEHLLRLMDGEEVQLAKFNFFKGKQELGDKVQLTPEHVILVEGIHGLNPELVRDIPTERAYRLYVSCLTQLNIDRHNRVPTTDVRLLRRMVRDAQFRGHSAQATLARWHSVRQGERTWIFPHQENAEEMFNSALVYELAALKPLAEPLLRQVDPASRYYIEAKRLLAFLAWVEPIDYQSLVPSNSVLREFTGGSILRNYLPGRPSELEA